jgi:hypothetical protein
MLFAGVNNWLSYINVSLISEFKNNVLKFKQESSLFYPLLKAIELSFFCETSMEVLVAKIILNIKNNEKKSF